MIKIDIFEEVAAHYKVAFLDSYGVLKNYAGMIDGVQQTLDWMRARGMVLRVLTNDASRSQQQQAASFARIGLRGIEAEEIITSGMMAKMFLEQKIRGGKVAYLGTENAADYILQANLEGVPVGSVDVEAAEDVSALVFLDDEGFDWNKDINKAINLLRHRNIPALVANSDKLYPLARNEVSVATGGIAKLVELILGRSFIHFGKPDTQMFNYAFEGVNKGAAKYEKPDILMVGDTLHTDILGGNKFGIATVLVLSGNTSFEGFEVAVGSSGIIPDYVCRSIVS